MCFLTSFWDEGLETSVKTQSIFLHARGLARVWGHSPWGLLDPHDRARLRLTAPPRDKAERWAGRRSVDGVIG